MKILLHGNAPTSTTGYGVQMRYLSRLLRDAGHDVAVSCTYGVQGAPRDWEGIMLYPSGYDAGGGNDIIHNHALHHFGGDPKGGWIIILTDLWVMGNPVLKDFQVVGWCPVDHYPVPPGVLRFFRDVCPDALAASMSRFGDRELTNAGLNPTYLPLAVDTSTFKPTTGGRELLGVEDDQFLVGMVSMNKDPEDRKGFNEAFRAFATFHREHPDSVLYVHADPAGMGGVGLNLRELAVHAGLPADAIRYPAVWDLQVGSWSNEMMAQMYSAFDVLLAPSRGEGFGVPLIEAQACGTPVIATDFSAQSELIRAGWAVKGQPFWHNSQHASYVIPSIAGIERALTAAYTAQGSTSLPEEGQAFAAEYDHRKVFEDHWVPFLESLEPAPPIELEGGRTMMDRVDIIVPTMRAENVARLVESLDADQSVIFVVDSDNSDVRVAIARARETVRQLGGPKIVQRVAHHKGRPATFAEKVNCGVNGSSADWIFVCGDDVEFTPGWLDTPRELSTRYDVIGCNDTVEGPGNPRTRSGEHSDHFFIRRSYIDQYGASLDGPGTVCHEGYWHYFTDVEVVELAKARGVWTPCLESFVIHHHPDLGRGEWDDVYQSFDSDHAKLDLELWQSRGPLVEMQR